MLNKQETIFAKMGTSLISKIRYDFSFKYSAFDFLKLRFENNMSKKDFLVSQLYKQV